MLLLGCRASSAWGDVFTVSHPHTPDSNPLDLQGGSQNTVPSADYFSCDQKIYTFSERGMLRHHGGFGIAHFPSYISHRLSCFAGCAHFVTLFYEQK